MSGASPGGGANPFDAAHAYHFLLKTLVIGEPGVGKTSLTRRAKDPGARLEKSHVPTIGVDFHATTLVTTDPRTGHPCRVKLQMWDTAGQETFRTITREYYRGKHIVFMVYDCARPDTLRDLRTVWLQEVRKHCDIDRCTVVVIGNKADLRHHRRPQRGCGAGADDDDDPHRSWLKYYLTQLLEDLCMLQGRPSAHIQVSAKDDDTVVPLLELAVRESLSCEQVRRKASDPPQGAPLYIGDPDRDARGATCCRA